MRRRWWRLTLCQECFPDPVIASHFCSLTKTGQVQPRGMKDRDLDELRRAGIADGEAFAWWNMGFVPHQVLDLIANGVTLGMGKCANDRRGVAEPDPPSSGSQRGFPVT